ncbi:MAG: EF-hand domain-containing protein [Candidatus Gastranaerophilaceae bacterium]|nr:EF-hand domain-containing protein [Candidatus Gastranaerophilaceae bacterium]
MANSGGNALLAGIYSGLTNTYSYLAAQYPNQVTLENINKARSDNKTAGMINQSFASYLQTNFNNIDKDKDGIISAEEMSNLTNRMSTQGLTKEELSQMYASGASGLSSGTMENILEHFDEMDTNHDGKITSEEISAYGLNMARTEKEDEFNNRRATDMSVFYGNESSSSDSYSILSYKYKNNKNT